jgi:hypothetical protein
MTTTDLVANLLAMSDWIDSEEQADILRKAATALEAARLTDAEREAIGVAIQCVEAARAQRHPEEEEARDLLWKTTCGLRSLLDRTDRT